MASGRAYLAAFASLHAIGDADERRRVARQGLAVIAQIAEREPAPLEGVPPEQLLLAVRAALGDGMLAELEWLSPAAGAIALFELAQALPAGAERRELRRRVLARLREADRETFVRLLVALARSSPRLLATKTGDWNAAATGKWTPAQGAGVDALRARTEVVLAAPLTAPGVIGELALGLLAQPMLAASWVEVPATGSLPARRLAARILAHGAREAVRRYDTGDRGGVAVLARAGLRGALARLLGDREALVWRFAGIARGLLAHVDPDLAAEIDRELKPTATSTQLRRAAASAAAALERGGAAHRWAPILVERAAREGGVARGAILGLAGYAVASPAAADDLATQLIECAPLDGVEALAELRRDEETDLLPHATALSRDWLRGQLDSAQLDDGRLALLHALVADLDARVPTEGLGAPLASARVALDAGNITAALRGARAAVDEVVAAADWLVRASDDDPLDRRHSLRLLRELDRELLADNTLNAVLALAPDADPARTQFAQALASIEAALLAREARPESGAVAHGGLRVARLRALVRILDGIRATGDADLEPRLAVVRQLMERAAADHSTLRRAVWAALTRAGDALLRDGHAEITDLLLVWTSAFPDEDFAIVREASMVPEIEAAFEAYVTLQRATWAAADPDDDEAIRAVVERVGALADTLPPEQSPRVESVRLAIAHLGNEVARITAVGSHAKVPVDALDALAIELGALVRRVYGARRRLGLPADEPSGELETAVRAVGDALGKVGALDEAIALAIDATRGLPPALAAAIERVLSWLARRPAAEEDRTRSEPDVMLPGWVPLSRQLGSFYVVRPLGRGAGGSVLLGVRGEERTRPDRELIALKVPEYSGGAARNLSEQEFEELFREEASALLSLPAHPNIARFITFDAAAEPKPILAMEYVRGHNLERTLEAGGLDMARAIAIVDDLFAGIEAMHRVRIAHLDVKPANVVLRESTGRAVLVDFGLAGRRLRTGCGSPHYGAAEVWDDDASAGAIEPFPADVYAAACVAFEVLTGSVLIRGDSLQAVLDAHLAPQPGAEVLAPYARDRELAPLVDLLRAAIVRDPARRPTAARLRAGFAAIARDLAKRRWPLDPPGVS